MAHQALSQPALLSSRPACPVPFQPAAPCGRSPGATPCTSKGDVSTSSTSSSSSASQVDRRTALILTSSLVTSYFQLHRAPAARAQEGGASTSSLTDPAPTTSNRGLARYIRKKRLDPLETYVPVVLNARSQLVSAGDVMATDLPAARSLLRQGAFSGVRDNIRALGEYAVQGGQAAAAAQLVPGFFTALNEFDQELLAATKSDAKLDIESARTKHTAAVKALDDLLATVPEDVLEKSRAILARATATAPAPEAAASSDDERLLRSLLVQQ